jgi:hypothetical protein
MPAKKNQSYTDRLVKGAKDFYTRVTKGNPVSSSLEKAAGKPAPEKTSKPVPGFRQKLKDQIKKDTAKKRSR